MSNFRIIYRFCDKDPLTKYNGIDKFKTLSNFIDVFGEEFTIVFDNTNEIIANNYEKSGKFNVVRTSLGNSGSFIKCLDIVSTYNDDDIVYLVEDDYLHQKLDLKSIINEGLNIADWVTLYDHPDKYMIDGPNPLVKFGAENSRVYLTKSTHWKTTNSTTMTFAAKAKTIKKYSPLMRGYLTNEIPRDFAMWNIILESTRLVSSIPGLATHCCEPWITPLYDWMSL